MNKLIDVCHDSFWKLLYRVGSSQTDYGRIGLVQNCITWCSNNTLQSEVVYDFDETGRFEL